MPTQELAARSPSQAHNPSSLQCKGKGVNGGENLGQQRQLQSRPFVAFVERKGADPAQSLSGAAPRARNRRHVAG